MKSCPRCNKTYPDSETFCETDGSALVSAGPAFTRQDAQPGSGVQCPVCGGNAEPGEIICNFCGARLVQDEESAPASPPPQATRVVAPAPGPGVTQAHRQTGAISDAQEQEGGRGWLGVIGYVTAAIVALAAGAWFALHLSSQKPGEETAAQRSPASMSSPAAGAGPIVSLANTLPVQVSGPGATSPDRSADAMRQAFEDNRGALLDAYTHGLTSDPELADGVLARIRIRPDGTVENAAVRASTSPNPSLDAELAKAMLGWKLAASSAGEVDADYPVIFAHDNAEASRIESDLHTKVASLAPTETPEYASVPMSAASPEAAASPGAAPSPALAAIPESPAAVSTPKAEAAKPRRRAPRHELAAIPKPSPSLFEAVQDRLKSNPKLRRVKAYTAGGTVTLYGRVFDDNTKALAERTVRGLPGVSSVVDTLTTDTAQWEDQQNRIAQQLQNAGLGKVTVKVIGRDAFLNGEVKTDLDRTRAVTIAEGAAPVTVRENLIRVEPGSMFGF